MSSPSPAVIDVRFLPPARVHAVLKAAITRLPPGDRVVVVCDEEAASTCRSVVEAHERAAWDVLEAPTGSIYARITRTG